MSENHKWTLVIDGLVLKRAKQQLDINFFKAMEEFESFMTNLTDNPDVYIDLLWIMCEKQAVQRQMDEFDFATELLGGTLIKSIDAFLIALAAFFQNDQMTEAVSLIVNERVKAREEVNSELKANLDQARQEIENSKPQTTTTASFTKSPENSESIRTQELFVK